MDPSLDSGEEKDFKAGLWELHEKTDKLPPLTDCKSLLNWVFCCVLINM